MFKYALLLLITLLFSTAIYIDNKDVAEIVESPILEIYPETIYQGDPILIRINSSSTPSNLIYNNKEIKLTKYDKSYIGLIGVDLKEIKRDNNLKLNLSNGITIDKPITVSMRIKDEKPLGIPDKLGGNTKEAGDSLLDNITKENASINNIKLATTSFWQNTKFSPPLQKLFITDEYGYSRNTVGYSIAHKGTDFRAIEGTEVMAINKGEVRISRQYTLSGNTIVIDHGSGLVSIYMHLSKLNVKEGDKVESGQIIGLSGKTGYVLGAHLHLAIKINGVSIDPAKFLKYFNVL